MWGSNSSINNGYPYLLWQLAGGTPASPTTLSPGGPPSPSTASTTTTSLPPGQNQINPIVTFSFNTTMAGATKPVIPTSYASLFPDSTVTNVYAWADLLTSPSALLNTMKPLMSFINNLFNNVAPVHDWIYYALQMGLTDDQISKIAESGFEAGVYLSSNGQPVLVFQSTNSLVDVNTDIWNALGATVGITPIVSQYSFAALLAAQVAKDYPFQNLTLTGFSLGGGLAAYAGATDKISAVTFDPAGVSNEANYNSSYVLNFQMSGDFAQTGGSLIGTTISFDQALTDQAAGSHPLLPPIVGSIERHAFSGVSGFENLATIPNLEIVN